ncbi:unannotated protein [freshwater metagenome]|uniref:Unannotated protein n=1 Tax=freshwater metagenome TaxID=449393 RepID=A0A6J7D148_9ZZZZ|nr:hypothetical protein [Actinomycetota bacterium]
MERTRLIIIPLAVIGAIAIALPAFGAPSPDVLAKRALGLAKKSDARSKKAYSRATQARTTARSAAASAGRTTVIKRTSVAVSATNADLDTALAAATKVPLASVGGLTMYGKCVKETSNPSNPGVYGRIFVSTTEAGSVFSSDENDSGNGYFGPATAEAQRAIASVVSYAGFSDPGTLNLSDAQKGGFAVMAPSGTSLYGMTVVGTKVGSPTAGDGAFGAGDRCIFGGYVIGA